MLIEQEPHANTVWQDATIKATVRVQAHILDAFYNITQQNTLVMLYEPQEIHRDFLSGEKTRYATGTRARLCMWVWAGGGGR